MLLLHEEDYLIFQFEFDDGPFVIFLDYFKLLTLDHIDIALNFVDSYFEVKYIKYSPP